MTTAAQHSGTIAHELDVPDVIDDANISRTREA
jgi:hypothetical protein